MTELSDHMYMKKEAGNNFQGYVFGTQMMPLHICVSYNYAEMPLRQQTVHVQQAIGIRFWEKE